MNPSVAELSNLIKVSLPDILSMESGNLSQVRLYRADDYWVAFERSAFNLCRAYAGSIVTPMKVSNAPAPIVMASVRDKDILSATRGLHCLRRDARLRIYGVAGLPGGNIPYNRWHSRKVRNVADSPAREKRVES